MDRPQVIKGALKFKSKNPNHKKTTVDPPPKHQEEAVKWEQKEQKEEEEEEIRLKTLDETGGKTPAERSFEIARKTRLIHKECDRNQLTMKQRL